MPRSSKYRSRASVCVNRYTWSPAWCRSLVRHFLLAWNVCWMQFTIIASWAAIRSYFACNTNCLTPLKVVSNEVSIPSWGMYPWFSSNGANPVVVLRLLFSANPTIGHLSAQFFWSLLMSILRIWPIEWFAHFVAPSIWGWNAVDMSSLVPISLCNSHQNVDVNLVSRSDTIDLGTPWSLTTSLRNSHNTSFAVTRVVVGTRCTCNVSQSMITNK